jgi:iron complex outermembrane receptor protein
VAEGFQAPSEANSFYVSNANLASINIKPQTSINYQVGTVYKNERFNAAADVYYVDFKNYAYNGPSDASGDPSYYGIASGAYYSGAEGEATYFLGGGVSLYGNASINNAKFKKSEMKVPTVPDSTVALGFVFDHAGFFGSFTEKYVGSWVVYDAITNPDLPGAGATRSASSESFWLGDLSLGYARKFDHSFIHSVKIRFQVGNVFNQKVQVLDAIDPNRANAYAKDVFNVLPERNYFVTISFEF